LVGYVEVYSTLFTLSGIEQTETTTEHHRCLDWRCLLGKQRKLSLRYKQKRNKLKKKNISEGKAKLERDKSKGLTYETGMAGPGGSRKETNQPGGFLEQSN
jgi:hypothetical protein